MHASTVCWKVRNTFGVTIVGISALTLLLLYVHDVSAPYEKILEDVHCPADLLKDLNSIWMVRVAVFVLTARTDDIICIFAVCVIRVHGRILDFL